MAEHVAVTSKGGGGDEAAELMARAMALHAKYPLFDGHNDLPWALHDGFAHITDPALGGPDLRQELKGQTYDKIRHRCLHTDIPRLRRGGAGAQFWSVYIPTTVVGDAAVQKTLEQIDCVHKLCERYPEAFEFAWTAADVLRIHAAGKVASVCGLEGGHHINNSLATLRMYHRLGCRYMTLTHNGGPGWAKPAVDSAGRWVLGGVARCAPDSPSAAGAPPLTRFGAAVVREMERIGMIVDLSHVHQETMRAVLALARSPVMFSHSSSQALCAHPRDVPDDVLEVRGAPPSPSPTSPRLRRRCRRCRRRLVPRPALWRTLQSPSPPLLSITVGARSFHHTSERRTFLVGSRATDRPTD